MLTRIEAALDKAEGGRDVCDRVDLNPTTKKLPEARDSWASGNCDALIALAGGLSNDTAKGAMA